MNLFVFSVISVWLFVSFNTGVQADCKWTRFYNRDGPSVTGDWEDLINLRGDYPGEICEKPDQIEALLTDGRPYTEGGDYVRVSPTFGLLCLNSDQGGKECADYKVRFCCPNECTWTQFYDRDDPSYTGDWEKLDQLRGENPGQICEKPDHIEALLTDGRPYTEGGDQLTISPTYGLLCLNNDQWGSKECADYKVRFCCPQEEQAPTDCKWTKFYNRDGPSGTGDWEYLNNLRGENPGQICEKPVDVEAQLTNGKPYTESGDRVTLNPTDGLICLNNHQAGGDCADYKVRFCCP